MSPKLHRVAVVVDPAFGQDLAELSTRVHVWVCDSPENRRVAERVWADAEGNRLETGITTFKYAPDDSPEGICIGILEAVDLHHGEHSQEPPWSILEVYGTELTSGIKVALEKFGVTSFTTMGRGFIGFRVEADAV